MLTGALILLAGIVIGRFMPGRRRKPKPPEPVEPICGCGHGFHDHDPGTKACHGRSKSYRYNPRIEDEVLDKYVDCTCRNYTGPEPLPSYVASEIAG